VICDRYVPSSLVLQRMDGIGWDVIRQLNDDADEPGLAVILNAAPDVIEARLNARGGHTRFERQPGSSRTESRLYHEAAERLAREGWPVCVVDVTTRTAREAAIIVSERILALHAAQPPEQP
jgi:dTMP kinase